jgi:hypothetical protein
MRRNTSTYLAGIVCAAILLFLGPGRPCHGQGMLPFQFDPDGAVGLGTNSDLSYDASTGEFHGTSLPLTLSSSTLPGGADFVRFSGNPLLSFDLFVNPDGTFRSNGSGFDLTGTLSIGGTNLSGTLLSGDFTAFGADPASPPTWVANALFDTTGGLLTQSNPLADGTTLAAQFPIDGAPVGVDFFAEHVSSGTLGDFTQNFSDAGKVMFGPTSIPEPASWVLVLIGIVVLGSIGLVKRRTTPGS